MTGNKTLSVAILSGKGGVGKTNIALNLGYCLHRANQSVLLMDCDLGLANLDVLLGIAPESTLQDLLDSEASASDVTVPITQSGSGFDLLPAASGVPELVNMDEEMRATLFAKLTPIVSSYDYLFLDLGAGITPTVMSFAAMAMLRLVVVTPEPTSMTDSYALMKVLATQHGVTDFHLIVNQTTSKKEEEQTFTRLHAACKKFLDIELKKLGAVRQDKALQEAVRRQVPLMQYAPSSDAGKDLFELAVALKKIRHAEREALANTPVLKDFRLKRSPGGAGFDRQRTQ